jgi:hypothetical protein
MTTPPNLHTLNPHAIYLISQKSTTSLHTNLLFPQRHYHAYSHWNLAVISDPLPPNAIADLTESIAQKSHGAATVTIVHYTPSSISTQGQHQWFLHQVMTKTNRLHSNKSKMKALKFTDTPTRNPQTLQKFWLDRKYNATSLMEAENAIENPSGGKVQIVLLHAAMEQLCLGLIYVFLGYTPQNYGLGYLLSVCDIFTDVANDIFPRQSAEDQRLLRLLSTNLHSLRKYGGDASDTDVEVLRALVWRFQEQSAEVVATELDRIANTKPLAFAS